MTDWRSMFLILAAFLLTTTVPLHWFSLERRWVPVPHDSNAQPHTVSTVIRTRQFWMLEISMLALAAALFSVTLALIPLFTEKGLTYELAAWALGLLGAGQVIGRLLYVAIPRTAAPWTPLTATADLSILRTCDRPGLATATGSYSAMALVADALAALSLAFARFT